jgi:hypothetical protein
VRGCGDMSLKGRKSARRAFGRLRPVGRLVGRTPEGREERRTGRAETHSRPGPSSPSPRSAAKPHERRPGSADNQDRSSHPLSPEPSGGSGRPDGYETPSSGFWARGAGNCASGPLALTNGRRVQSSTEGRRHRVTSLGTVIASDPRKQGTRWGCRSSSIPREAKP